MALSIGSSYFCSFRDRIAFAYRNSQSCTLFLIEIIEQYILLLGLYGSIVFLDDIIAANVVVYWQHNGGLQLPPAVQPPVVVDAWRSWHELIGSSF